MPVVTIGPWIECEVYGLMLEETGKKDEFRRVGKFRARSDIANVFRRPAYPMNRILTGDQGVQGVSNHEKGGWFGRRKKTDETTAWKERVITII